MDFIKYLNQRHVEYTVDGNGKIAVGGSLDLSGCGAVASPSGPPRHLYCRLMAVT